MGQFEMVKLLVDIGLGASLLYLAFRFLRGGISDGQARQLATLDASLKSLIREAEVSGNNLNDQLLRRQQSIESALRDIESNEGKLQRAIVAAKDLQANLDEQMKKVREDLLDVERRKVRIETEHEISARTITQNRQERVAPQTPAKSITPRPEPIRARVVEVTQEEPLFLEETEEEEETVQNFERVNIFGEPISDSTPTEVISQSGSTRSALQQAVEKMVEKKRSSSALSRPALDAINFAAEEMLRAGKNLEAVAARTKLSLDEVRALSQKVMRDSILEEPQSYETRARDQRLGVLASQRRQDQTI
jgi:hypothetical protein